MIFRVKDSKIYEINVKNEQKFLDKQKNGAITYIQIEEDILPEYTGKAFYILGDDDKIILDETRINEFELSEYEKLKSNRYKQLEQLLSSKWIGIQAIAIDKPWMTDSQAIQAQIDSYSKLADGARELLIDDPENEILLGIIAKDVSAKRLLFEANFLMQQVKTILATKIAENDPKIDEKITFARGFEMTKEDVLDADNSVEMATQLITYLNS